MHGVPIIVGFVLAFAGIPFYQNDIFARYISPPPFVEEWAPIVVFLMVPLL
jgi:hypothetical protein